MKENRFSLERLKSVMEGLSAPTGPFSKWRIRTVLAVVFLSSTAVVYQNCVGTKAITALFATRPKAQAQTFTVFVQEDRCKLCPSGTMCIKYQNLAVDCIPWSPVGGSGTSSDPWTYGDPSASGGGNEGWSQQVRRGECFGTFCCPNTANSCQAGVDSAGTRVVSTWVPPSKIGPAPAKSWLNTFADFMGLGELYDNCALEPSAEARTQCNLEKLFAIVGFGVGFLGPNAPPGNYHGAAQWIARRAEDLMQNCNYGSCTGAAFQGAQLALRNGFDAEIAIYEGFFLGERTSHAVTVLYKSDGSLYGTINWGKFHPNKNAAETLQSEGFSGIYGIFRGELPDYVEYAKRGRFVILSPATRTDP